MNQIVKKGRYWVCVHPKCKSKVLNIKDKKERKRHYGRGAIFDILKILKNRLTRMKSIKKLEKERKTICRRRRIELERPLKKCLRSLWRDRKKDDTGKIRNLIEKVN